MTGLKLVLEVEAMSHHPTSLVQCMKEVQLVNDCNIVLKLALCEFKTMGWEKKKPNQANPLLPLPNWLDQREVVPKHITIPIKVIT